jgi:AraC-like DNA-binding protein
MTDTFRAPKRSGREPDIEPLSYRPAAPYPYDLEVFRVSDLKRRTHAEKMHQTYRYECHMLVCVTQGHCVQLVDFTPVSCKAGVILALRPGQAHNFGRDEHWDGWIVLFRPEFLLPALSASRHLQLAFDLDRLPDFISLNGDDLRRASESIDRMREDASLQAPPEDVHALLRYQLYALVAWLVVIHDRRRANEGSPSSALLHFMRFQKLVEQRFSEWSQVDAYAKHLACTERSLTRATTKAVNMSAKAFISARVNLEAKRLLAHTGLPISVIAERLCFEEATHFSKFFKRNTGCTPTEFRLRAMQPNL